MRFHCITFVLGGGGVHYIGVLGEKRCIYSSPKTNSIDEALHTGGGGGTFFNHEQWPKISLKVIFTCKDYYSHFTNTDCTRSLVLGMLSE